MGRFSHPRPARTMLRSHIQIKPCVLMAGSDRAQVAPSAHLMFGRVRRVPALLADWSLKSGSIGMIRRFSPRPMPSPPVMACAWATASALPRAQVIVCRARMAPGQAQTRRKCRTRKDPETPTLSAGRATPRRSRVFPFSGDDPTWTRNEGKRGMHAGQKASASIRRVRTS